MPTINENINQLFSNMLQAAHSWLQGCRPEEVSKKTGIPFDGAAFHLKSFGIPVSISYPDYHITPKLEQWHILSLLHYLSTADGTALTGDQILFHQYKDGLVRGGGFDRDAEKAIASDLGVMSQDEILERCLMLGGVIETSNADLCVRFSFAPKYPMWLKLWYADEEFPASGRILLDSSAEHYLSIEDAVTIGELLLSMLSD